VVIPPATVGPPTAVFVPPPVTAGVIGGYPGGYVFPGYGGYYSYPSLYTAGYSFPYSYGYTYPGNGYIYPSLSAGWRGGRGRPSPVQTPRW
jgi:hypothetical protein